MGKHRLDSGAGRQWGGPELIDKAASGMTRSAETEAEQTTPMPKTGDEDQSPDG